MNIDNPEPDPVNPAEPTEIDARDHFRRNGLDWGAGDLVVAGGSSRVLADLLACLHNAYGADQKPAVHRIVVIQPPDPDGKKKIISAIVEAAGRWSGQQPTAKQEALFSQLVCVISPDTLEMESVLSIIREVEPLSAVVVRFASSYRAATLQPDPPGEALPLIEDVWAPHLHALCVNSLAAVQGREVYVAIEAGEEWPVRKANQDLLLSIEGFGVLAGGVRDGPATFLASRIDVWNDALRIGALGPVLREIAALPSHFELFRRLWQLRLLKTARLDGLARNALAAVPLELGRIRPAEALFFAEIAADLGNDQIATQLLQEIRLKAMPPEFLETYLNLTARLGSVELASQAEDLLAAKYPNSPALRAYRVQEAISSFDYRAAAILSLKEASGGGSELADLYSLLAEKLTGNAADYEGASEAYRAYAAPHRRIATTLIADHALRHARPGAALAAALPETNAVEVDENLARLILRAVQATLLASRGAEAELISQKTLSKAISAVLGVVARMPGDGELRNELTRTLSTESMGLNGLATLLSITLNLVRKPQTMEPLPDLGRWAKPASEDVVAAYMGPALRWMAQSSPVMIGRVTLPQTLVPKSPDPIIMALIRVLQSFNPIDTDARAETLIHLLGCAMALAPHGSIKDTDLSMLRLVADRMALANRHQKARDYAETALLLAGDDPRRARVAWLCQGDVYARSNNLHEALIAVACGLMADGSVTPDQIWYESMLLFRIARDLRMADRALAFLEAGRQALSEFGALEKYKCEIDTSVLQLRLLSLSERDSIDVATLPELMADLTDNARAVLSGDHQIAPVAVLLGQVVREATMAGLGIPQDSLDVLTALAKRCDPSLSAMLATASKGVPTAIDALALVRALDPARHAEDLAFDLRQIVVVARRLLAGEQASADGAIAAFAIELLSDLAIAPADAGGAGVSWLPKDIGVPLARAIALASEASLPVVFMGLDSDDALLRVTIEPNGALPPVRETEPVFSRHRLYDWVKEFPFRYGVDTDSFNLFHTSTEGLGVSDLPPRAALISSTILQRIPPNIFRIEEQFAGDNHRLFVAPSMAWLEAARKRPAGSGRSVAWISTEAAPNGNLTLQMIANRLRHALEEHRIDLDEDASLPTKMAGAELAVVAAHGGLLPGGFYFHVIGNDSELKAAARHLADAIRGVGVAVLFICSGGRVDSHPMASTTIGLVKYALEAGCNAVVASPWPLDARVPSYWLPAFLDAWEQGQPVVDAAYDVNQAVRRGFSSEHRDYLAMNVYGNGLRTRADQSAAATR